MPDFANFLEPPPPPSSPAALPLISRSIIDAGDPNSKPPSKLGTRDSDPQLKSECPNPKPDEQCNELDTELNYKSDSTIEHQDSDLSSEPELRVVHREDEVKCQSNGEIRVRGCQRDLKRFATANKSLDEFVKDWVTRSVNAGVPEHRCFLPFLSQAPKSVECPVCQNLIFPGEDLSCSVRGCQVVVHQLCAIERLGFSSTKQFKCPQHVSIISQSLI